MGISKVTGGVLAATVASFLMGCATGPCCVAPASDQAKADMLGSVQRLAGTWEIMDEKGQWGPYGSFTPCSGGTAVREIMFPGSPHEMTNMYTMQGGSLMMTHYCAMGNQPHAKCANAIKHSDGSVSLPFESDGVSDLNAPDEAYMGRMTLTLNADGTATQEWWQLKQGKLTNEHHMVFKLRKKA